MGVAEMLNKTPGRKWRVAEDGKVEIEDGEATQASQFVALSKVLDATELGLLVRIKMGVAEVDVADCGVDGDWHGLQHVATQSGHEFPACSDTIHDDKHNSRAIIREADFGCCGLRACYA